MTQYWNSRQWYYDALYAPARLKKIAEADLSFSAPIAAPRRRREAADQLDLGISPPDPAVCEVLRSVTIDPHGTLSHAGFEAPVRPMALRLLEAICRSAGRALPMADLCHALWGRSSPASVSALHTTVFRANDALLRARCPLRIRIQERWATITYAKLLRSTKTRATTRKARPQSPLEIALRIP